METKTDKFKITKEQFDNYEDMNVREYKEFIDRISKRFSYIIQVFEEFFRIKFAWYDFDKREPPKGQSNEIDLEHYDIVHEGMFPIISLLDKGDYTKALYIVKEGHFDLSEGFPVRWLWEDFEDELKEGIELSKKQIEEEEQKEKEKVEDRKTKNFELAQSIALKITPEELKFLKTKGAYEIFKKRFIRTLT